jgi:hypothetical protein
MVAAMIVIDVAALLDKIPRPDRHGWIGIFFSLTILYAIVGPIPNSGEGSLICEIFPWKCEAQQAERQTENLRRFQYVQLVFTGKPLKEPLCFCHSDYKVPGSDAIHHVFTGTDPIDCASSGAYKQEWQKPFWDTLMIGSGRDMLLVPNVSAYRYHCTTDGRYMHPMGPPFEIIDN